MTEAFWVSWGSVATAEMGDRTQLLALLLAARYRRPWPIVAGVLCATLVNHGIAGLVGAWLGRRLTPEALSLAVGVSMVAMALWTLKPDKVEEGPVSSSRFGAFAATVVAFFIAEIGDKTQLATVALAAAYPSLPWVIAGTTCGMLTANVPVVFLGNAFARKLPLAAIRIIAAAVFIVLGIVFIVRALRH